MEGLLANGLDGYAVGTISIIANDIEGKVGLKWVKNAHKDEKGGGDKGGGVEEF